MENVRALWISKRWLNPTSWGKSPTRGQQDPEGTICMMGPSGRDPAAPLQETEDPE